MNREEFESLLMQDNVVENFMGMSKDEIDVNFGTEICDVIEFGNQNNAHHQYELFEHILRVVENVAQDGLSRDESIKLKIAAFFHDIAKPKVATLNEKTGQTQYIGHAKASADMAKEILDRLGYEEQEIAEICFLVQNHDEFTTIAKTQDVTEERVSKILNSIAKKTEGYRPTISSYRKLISLCKADVIAQSETVEKNGEVIDTREGKLERYNAIESVLSKAIIFSQESEIGKLEKRKLDIQIEPAPIVKNGRVVNQKQIDNWRSMTPEIISQKLAEIDAKVSELRKEEDVLLEKPSCSITLSDIANGLDVINERNESIEIRGI